MPDIGLITCRRLPEPDPDHEMLSNALSDAGIAAGLIPWDDDASRPSDYKLCVFRSCWNYFEDIDAFLRWVGHTERVVGLTNPAEVIRWNIHKRYLRSLEANGIRTVPTVFGWRGQRMDLHRILLKERWNDIVLKPAISANSYRTVRFRPGHIDRAQRFLDELLKDRDMMIQPYLSSVESTGGERSVIGIDGAWTHTVRKSPRFEGGDEAVSQALAVSNEEAAIADRCLDCMPDEVFYIRIDLIRDEEGRMCVSEVEVIEPTLFLSQSPAALDRYVSGLVRIVG